MISTSPEAPRIPNDPTVSAPTARPARSRIVWRTRSCWLVHLGLLVFAAAALGTLQLLHVRNAVHADIGLVFAGLVVAVGTMSVELRANNGAPTVDSFGPRRETHPRVLGGW